MMTAVAQLTLRDLNRATLARQHLLERATMPAIDLIEHLVGMQSQEPAAPFRGLWTRLDDFRFDELSDLMVSKAAVRMLVMRGTVHLLSGRDALGLQPHMQPVFDREFKSVRGKALAAARADPDLISARSRELLAAGPWTARQMSEVLMAEHPEWPETLREHVAAVPRVRLPLVQIPPRGVWGIGGQTTYRLIEDWLGAERDPYPMGEIVKRYLAAFGPATVMDFQAWCGLTRMKPVFEDLGDELIELEGPGGERLFDLPGAPRPPADTPAPVRILPEFDNVLLSHADRSRVISDERRKAMSTLNGMVPGVVLVDGFVAALAKVASGKPAGERLRVMPLEPLSAGVTAEIEHEGTRMLTAMGGRWVDAPVVFEDPGERWRPHEA